MGKTILNYKTGERYLIEHILCYEGLHKTNEGTFEEINHEVDQNAHYIRTSQLYSVAPRIIPRTAQGIGHVEGHQKKNHQINPLN